MERVLGYAESEWIGLPVASIFTPEDQALALPKQELTKARETGRAADIRWYSRKGGERLFVEGTMVALRNDIGE